MTELRQRYISLGPSPSSAVRQGEEKIHHTTTHEDRGVLYDPVWKLYPLVFGLFVFFISSVAVVVLQNRVPKVVPSDGDKSIFSEARAREYIGELSGPYKHVGSEFNEVVTPKYLLRIIDERVMNELYVVKKSHYYVYPSREHICVCSDVDLVEVHVLDGPICVERDRLCEQALKMQVIRYELQRTQRNNGSISNQEETYFLDITEYGHFKGHTLNSPHASVSLYSGINNVTVRFSKKQTSSHSNQNPSMQQKNFLLINSHFDGFPSSPAAADASSCIAVMLETLFALLHSPGFSAPLIFNFNGAEETSLQGSHAFATSHPWAGLAGAAINLEASGSGVKEVLFQSTRNAGRLLQIYRDSVPYPRGSSIAQELYEKRLIPGFTDFAVFRKELGIPAVDMAWAGKGYFYHTSQDVISRIPAGAIQHYGENVLAFVKGVGDEMMKEGSIALPNSFVFNDILGLKFLALSRIDTGSTLAFLSMLWSLMYKLERETHKPFIISVLTQPLFFVSHFSIASILSLSLAYTLTEWNLDLSWFSNPYLALAMYGGVAFFAWILTSYCYQFFSGLVKPHREPAERESTFFNLNVLSNCLMCAAASYYRSDTYWIPQVWLTSQILFRILSHILASGRSTEAWKGLVFCVGDMIGSVFPLLMTLDVLYSLVDCLVPTLGRIGLETIRSEIFVGYLICLGFSYVFHNLSGCLQYISMKRMKKLLFLAFCTMLLIILGILRFTSPFTEDSPKRFEFRHFQTNVRSTEGIVDRQHSGLSVRCMDSLCFNEKFENPEKQLFKNFVRTRTVSRFADSLQLVDKFLRKIDIIDITYLPLSNAIMPIKNSFTFFPLEKLLFQQDKQNPLIRHSGVSIPTNIIIHNNTDSHNNTTTLFNSIQLDTTPIHNNNNNDKHVTSMIKPTILHYSSQEQISSETQRIYFTISGGQRITLFIPSDNITGWSFGGGLPNPIESCRCYVIWYTGGLEPRGFSFYLERPTDLQLNFSSTSVFYGVVTPELKSLMESLESHEVVNYSIAEHNMWAIP